jgi:hypothetical protein
MMIYARVRAENVKKYHVQKDAISAPELQIDNLIFKKIPKQNHSAVILVCLIFHG